MQKIIFESEQIVLSKVIKNLRMIDYNSKKHCNVMVEVNFAPSKRITQTEMDNTIFLVTWEDGSQGQYQLVDVNRFTLNDCFSSLTLPSHGMDFFDFYHWFKEVHPEVDGDTMMCGYFYKKII